MASAPRRERTLDRLTAPSPALVLAVLALLLAADRVYPHIGDNLAGGVCDELAHLLTGVLVLMAIPTAVTRRFATGVLAGSVLIDLDHIPLLLGSEWLTHGTPRPYTHSLLTPAAVGLLALAWRRQRPMLTGVLAGLIIHFSRDLAESNAGMSLLWPWTRASQSVPHWSYLVLVCGLSLWAAIRGHRRSNARVGGKNPVRSVVTSSRT